MIKHNEETELKIKKAAREVFLEYGRDGARMQMIADRAGVNKALLHYYFRSKERLFYEIIKDSFADLFRFVKTIPPSIPFKTFLQMFIDAHIDFVKDNHQLLMFVFWEFRRNNSRVMEMINEFKSYLPGDPKQIFLERIEEAINRKEIKPIDPSHFILNLLALDIFPFLIQPVFQSVFNMNDQEYETLLSQRKKEVFTLLWNSIKAEQHGE